MGDVEFKRFGGKYRADCDSCGSTIRKEQAFFRLYFNNIDQTIHICEDCGNNMQNDMSDEYCKFVDLGL